MLLRGARWPCCGRRQPRLSLAGRPLERLTGDHSLAELAGPDAAESSVITRAVGVEPDLDARPPPRRRSSGDRFLLCSDGLTRVLPESRSRPGWGHPTIQAAVDGLIKATLDAGAPDNVTVLIAEAVPSERADYRPLPFSTGHRMRPRVRVTPAEPRDNEGFVMSAQWEGQALLEPISAEQPCGENLEDTAVLSSFDALRLFGQARSPEAPPDVDGDEKELAKAKPPIEWGQIRDEALEALSKSKDLRLLAYLGTALLRTDGLPAFTQTLDGGVAMARYLLGAGVSRCSTRTPSPGGTR